MFSTFSLLIILKNAVISASIWWMLSFLKNYHFIIRIYQKYELIILRVSFIIFSWPQAWQYFWLSIIFKMNMAWYPLDNIFSFINQNCIYLGRMETKWWKGENEGDPGFPSCDEKMWCVCWAINVFITSFLVYVLQH